MAFRVRRARSWHERGWPLCSNASFLALRLYLSSTPRRFAPSLHSSQSSRFSLHVTRLPDFLPFVPMSCFFPLPAGHLGDCPPVLKVRPTLSTSRASDVAQSFFCSAVASRRCGLSGCQPISHLVCFTPQRLVSPSTGSISDRATSLPRCASATSLLLCVCCIPDAVVRVPRHRRATSLPGRSVAFFSFLLVPFMSHWG